MAFNLYSKSKELADLIRSSKNLLANVPKARTAKLGMSSTTTLPAFVDYSQWKRSLIYLETLMGLWVCKSTFARNPSTGPRQRTVSSWGRILRPAWSHCIDVPSIWFLLHILGIWIPNRTQRPWRWSRLCPRSWRNSMISPLWWKSNCWKAEFTMLLETCPSREYCFIFVPISLMRPGCFDVC